MRKKSIINGYLIFIRILKKLNPEFSFIFHFLHFNQSRPAEKIKNKKNYLKSFKQAYFLIATLILMVPFLFPNTTAARSQGYPKLANYFLKTPISQDEVLKLAKWDVVILGMQAQDTNPEIFGQLRALNPNIKIIAYLSAMEFPIQNLGNLESVKGPWHKMYQEINWVWYLKDGSGKPHSIWPGNYSFNVTKYCPDFKGQKFNEFLPKFIKSKLMGSGYWDGVFLDNVLNKISVTNNGRVDIDNNYKIDEAGWADQEWRKGMLTLLENTRKALGKNKIILVNSSSYGRKFINGRLYENWPDKWQGGWVGQMQDYKNLENNLNYYPQIIILNPNTENTGNNLDYKKIRFGLTSTLLNNGYFAFDFGTQDHSQLWWYDEYDIDLGYPNSQPKNILDKNSVQYKEGVWRRDFTNGIVLVNSTRQTQSINLGPGVYEKIRGKQDPKTNNGRLVKKIILPSHDGIILLKKLLAETGPQNLSGAKANLNSITFSNGSYVRVFNKRGKVKRTGFFAYDPRFPGGAEIVISDLNNDGQNEITVAGKSKIQIFNENGLLIQEFYPYGKNYAFGINIAIGNLMGDNKKEIVTGTQRGAKPQIKIFDANGNVLNPGWLAYAENFHGGVNLALGDLNGNGYQEIVTGAGFGGGPHVRIFDANGHLFDPGFFPYNPKFRGGVNVACGDLNNDGKDEIITGAGKSGGPHVRIYDKIGHLIDPGFFAFNPNKRNGVRVGAVDVDKDGKVEILGMQ